MKRITTILLALLAVIGLCACTGRDQGAPAPTQAQAAATAQSGDKLMNFETSDINGEPISFADFSDKKVIMVNFWETWCPPCMGELPELEALYEKYKDEGFMLLGVCSNSEKEEILSTVDRLGLTYPVFMVTDSLKGYQTQYVPTTVFVNGSGELLKSEPDIGSKSGQEWESIITDLLGN